MLLAGSVFLYPLCGYAIDRMKKGPILHVLFVLSSLLTILCYFWLVLPPSLARTPIPAIVLYALGQGFAPLLLVIIVPTLVSSKYVPTTLGAHKSMEQTGATIFQTFAGLFLDNTKPNPTRAEPVDVPSKAHPDTIQQLLNLLLFLNGCQLVAILFLCALDRRRKRQAAEAALRMQRSPELSVEDDMDTVDPTASPKGVRRKLSFAKERPLESHSLQRRATSLSDGSLPVVPDESEASLQYMADGPGEEEQPLLREEITNSQLPPEDTEPPMAGEARTKWEMLRGEVFGCLSIGLICFAWIFFIGTAYLKLRSKEDRGS